MTEPFVIEFSDFPVSVRPGARPKGVNAKTAVERKRKQRAIEGAERLRNIAILDTETDPFDANTQDKIFPFLAVLYSLNFEPIVIWENDNENFIAKLLAAIESLPDTYTIYAHNGGKFDYMFFIHRLRGKVSFKGRGIMSAKIGAHELRDSFHILPEKLKNWKKDEFDYRKMQKSRREKYRQEIIAYCINDCKYLLEFVRKFVDECGLKISIGQAAMTRLKQSYKVASLGENTDAFLRQWFFGGRVECLSGAGQFGGSTPWKLYDVNSMYPYVMANFQHPISNEFFRRSGKPGPNTVFIKLHCTNQGALIRRGENNETTAGAISGTFLTTIWEYNAAIKHNLIRNVLIEDCIDFMERSDFSKFVNPIYDRRLEIKKQLKKCEEESPEWLEHKKDDYLLKYLMNNAYGKFAQNPRRFKEHWLTNPGEKPPVEAGEGWGDLPAFESNTHVIWERPNPNVHFNNVATAASITGAARAILLDAIHNSVDPIYCDTDSLICRDLSSVEIDPVKLGAWDLEKEFDEVIICGKKEYICKVKGKQDGQEGRYKVRCKGAQFEQDEILDGRVWNKFQSMLDGKIIQVLNRAPTMNKKGDQFYMRRNIRATATRRSRLATGNKSNANGKSQSANIGGF